ncbi:Os10g0362150, partial [Oryza sativa Japonica Group]
LRRLADGRGGGRWGAPTVRSARWVAAAAASSSPAAPSPSSSPRTAGADPSSGAAAAAGRRVYVTNVAPGASAERLRAFFAGFGELEGGPFGFDAETGFSRGCALFVYRAAEGASSPPTPPGRANHACRRRCVESHL